MRKNREKLMERKEGKGKGKVHHGWTSHWQVWRETFVDFPLQNQEYFLLLPVPLLFVRRLTGEPSVVNEVKGCLKWQCMVEERSIVATREFHFPFPFASRSESCCDSLSVVVCCKWLFLEGKELRGNGCLGSDGKCLFIFTVDLQLSHETCCSQRMEQLGGGCVVRLVYCSPHRSPNQNNPLPSTHPYIQLLFSNPVLITASLSYHFGI